MMKFRTRLGVAAIAAGAAITMAFAAQAADVVRIGVPTKTYWPTILITAGIEKGIFAQEDLEAEMTVHRGGGETFEAIAAAGADIGTVAAELVAIARTRGVDPRPAGNGADEWPGWFRGAKGDS